MLDCSVLSASFQTLTCKLAVKGSKFGLLNSWSQSATMDFVRSEFCLFMTCSSLRRGFKKQFYRAFLLPAPSGAFKFSPCLSPAPAAQPYVAAAYIRRGPRPA